MGAAFGVDILTKGDQCLTHLLPKGRIFDPHPPAARRGSTSTFCLRVRMFGALSFQGYVLFNACSCPRCTAVSQPANRPASWPAIMRHPVGWAGNVLESVCLRNKTNTILADDLELCWVPDGLNPQKHREACSNQRARLAICGTALVARGGTTLAPLEFQRSRQARET